MQRVAWKIKEGPGEKIEKDSVVVGGAKGEADLKFLPLMLQRKAGTWESKRKLFFILLMLCF